MILGIGQTTKEEYRETQETQEIQSPLQVIKGRILKENSSPQGTQGMLTIVRTIKEKLPKTSSTSQETTETPETPDIPNQEMLLVSIFGSSPVSGRKIRRQIPSSNRSHSQNPASGANREVKMLGLCCGITPASMEIMKDCTHNPIINSPQTKGVRHQEKYLP